jgi:uncharacterized protein (TIGR02246 family)
MTRRSAIFGFALIPIAVLAFAAGRADDIATIKKSSADFEAAWNKHDPKAIAAFWAADGDLIDPWGKTAVGREAVEKFFAGEHTGNGVLAHTTYEIKTDSVRLISPDVALQDWGVVITGLRPEGAPAPLGPQFHRVVIIRKKEGGQWPVVAARPGLPEPVKEPGAPMRPAK